MSENEDMRRHAWKKIQLADHFLTVTYPMVKDPKMLLSIAENIHTAFEKGMDAFLEHEYENKNINFRPGTFQTRMHLLKEKSENYGFDEKHIEAIVDLKNILDNHMKSPVEFSKGDKYIICSDQYDLDSLSPERMKGHLESAKRFMREVEGVCTK